MRLLRDLTAGALAIVADHLRSDAARAKPPPCVWCHGSGCAARETVETDRALSGMIPPADRLRQMLVAMRRRPYAYAEDAAGLACVAYGMLAVLATDDGALSLAWASAAWDVLEDRAGLDAEVAWSTVPIESVVAVAVNAARRLGLLDATARVETA